MYTLKVDYKRAAVLLSEKLTLVSNAWLITIHRTKVGFTIRRKRICIVMRHIRIDVLQSITMLGHVTYCKPAYIMHASQRKPQNR